MRRTVPADQQCSMPSCEQEATTTVGAGSLCDHHVKRLGVDTGDSNSDETETSQDPSSAASSTSQAKEFTHADRATNGRQDDAEVDLHGIEPNTFPTDLAEHGARWLLWQYSDDRKVPRNLSWGYSNQAVGYAFVGAKDPNAWFDFETASNWVDHDDDLGFAYYLTGPDRDDWDDDEKYAWVDPEEDVPSFRTPVPLETDFTVSLTVENVGDRAVEDVTVTAEDGPFSGETDDVGTLSAGASHEFSRVIEAATTGETVLTVAANGTDIPPEQREVTHTVNSKQQFAGIVIDRLQLLNDQISGAESLNKSRQRSLVAKLDAAIQSIRDAIAAAESDDAAAADQKLSTAINQLGALLNELAAGDGIASGNGKSKGGGNGNSKGGAKINDELRDQATRSTEGSIELLNTARTVAIAE